MYLMARSANGNPKSGSGGSGNFHRLHFITSRETNAS